MAVERVEVGLVSADETLVDFYTTVFELRSFGSAVLPQGTVHRLGTDRPMLKVMVPAQPPTAPEPASSTFWTRAGIRYCSLWVDDITGVRERCSGYAGAAIALAPIELRPGIWTMVVHDPDGNVVEVMEART